MAVGFEITPAMLKQWAEDRDRLAIEIADRQQLLTSIQKKLAAAAVLSESITPKTGALETAGHAPATANGHVHPGDNMTLAIEQIANHSAAPITKKELRKQLSALGFPAERLGPYFYTAITRLSDKGRITRTRDGRITRALA
jgi:hypothetical protein